MRNIKCDRAAFSKVLVYIVICQAFCYSAWMIEFVCNPSVAELKPMFDAVNVGVFNPSVNGDVGVLCDREVFGSVRGETSNGVSTWDAGDHEGSIDKHCILPVIGKLRLLFSGEYLHSYWPVNGSGWRFPVVNNRDRKFKDALGWREVSRYFDVDPSTIATPLPSHLIKLSLHDRELKDASSSQDERKSGYAVIGNAGPSPPRWVLAIGGITCSLLGGFSFFVALFLLHDRRFPIGLSLVALGVFMFMLAFLAAHIYATSSLYSTFSDSSILSRVSRNR